MAIVVEEEKQGINITRILLWLIVLSIVVAAAYYLFFAQEEVVTVVPPPSLRNLEPIAEINLVPEDVINKVSGALKSYITVAEPGNSGRSNPFVAP